VEIDANLVPLEMPGGVFDDLCKHAREAHPEECCGLIFGTVEQRFARAVLCRNEMTQRHGEDPVRFPRDNRTGFWMSQADYGRALAEAGGDERVTAVYHSHVDFGVYLSEHDLDYAEPGVFPDADQIVISVRTEAVGGETQGRIVGAGIFRRERVGSPLIGRRLVAGTP
jgi:proteasome lid subunit RPN8/RPN11